MVNDEYDIINSVMLQLRISEHIQNRVIEYYDDMTESFFVNNYEVYDHLSTSMSDFIKLYQIRKSVHDLKFINTQNMRQIENFVSCMNVSFYLPSDIILKQGSRNDRFYFVHEGLLEVIQEKQDFEFYDLAEVDRFINEKEQQEEEPDPPEQIRTPNQPDKHLVNTLNLMISLVLSSSLIL